MPSITLDMLLDRSIMSSAEDYYYLDALKWQFKQMEDPCDIPYLYCIEGRLYVDALTPRQSQTEESSVASKLTHNPETLGTNRTVSVKLAAHEASTPAEALELPIQRKEIDVGELDQGRYIVIVEFDPENRFRFQIDTGSHVSWVCGFEPLKGSRVYTARDKTEIPGSSFRAEYVDRGRVSGVLCKQRTKFGRQERGFKMSWSFGVATEANSAIKDHVHDGILALSFVRAASDLTFNPASEGKTFIEQMQSEGIITEPTFCIKINKRNPSKIIFGDLPDIGHSRTFKFQDVVGRRWAVKQSEIYIWEDQVRTKKHSLEKNDESKPAAIFDTGSAYIYMNLQEVAWLYNEICGSDGYFRVDARFYLTKSGVERLKKVMIGFVLGDVEARLPASVMQGPYSDQYHGFMGAIQSKGAGSTIDDGEWAYNIFGVAFFYYVWMAFDAELSYPRIAICPATPDD